LHAIQPRLLPTRNVIAMLTGMNHLRDDTKARVSTIELLDACTARCKHVYYCSIQRSPRQSPKTNLSLKFRCSEAHCYFCNPGTRLHRLSVAISVLLHSWKGTLKSDETTHSLTKR
jgi:hypothetical protein